MLAVNQDLMIHADLMLQGLLLSSKGYVIVAMQTSTRILCVKFTRMLLQQSKAIQHAEAKLSNLEL